jgi:hypothetical protein
MTKITRRVLVKGATATAGALALGGETQNSLLAAGQEQQQPTNFIICQASYATPYFGPEPQILLAIQVWCAILGGAPDGSNLAFPVDVAYLSNDLYSGALAIRWHQSTAEITQDLTNLCIEGVKRQAIASNYTLAPNFSVKYIGPDLNQLGSTLTPR